jgi:hypothetical protein
VRSCELFQAAFSIQMTGGSERVKKHAENGTKNPALSLLRAIALDTGDHSNRDIFKMHIKIHTSYLKKIKK